MNEATEARLFKKSKRPSKETGEREGFTLVFNTGVEDKEGNRYSIDKKRGVVTINQPDRIPISELVPLILKKRRAYKFLTRDDE